jgi:hypothetical protein
VRFGGGQGGLLAWVGNVDSKKIQKCNEKQGNKTNPCPESFAEKEENIGTLVTTNKDKAKPILEICRSVELDFLLNELPVNF